MSDASSTADAHVRQSISTTVRQLLEGELTKAAYLEAIEELISESEEPSTAYLAIQLFTHFSMTDESICDSKEHWDQTQRFLLAIETGAEVQLVERRYRHHSQLIAVLCVAFYAIAFVNVVPNLWLLGGLLILASGVNRLLLKYRDDAIEKKKGSDNLRIPFETYSDIKKARRQSPHFKKAPFNASLLSIKKQPSRLYKFAGEAVRLLFWIGFAPVLALSLMTSEDNEYISVIGKLDDSSLENPNLSQSEHA